MRLLQSLGDNLVWSFVIAVLALSIYVSLFLRPYFVEA
jgi:hypothetical protein